MIDDYINKADEILGNLGIVTTDMSIMGMRQYRKYLKAVYIVYVCKMALVFYKKFGMLDEDLIIRYEKSINEFYDEAKSFNIVYSNIDNSGTVPTIPTDKAVTGWKSQILTVNNDGDTIIRNLPFNIKDVDVGTIFLTIDGDDPIYGLTRDYHIEDNILHWHGFYDLTKDMDILIKWKD